MKVYNLTRRQQINASLEEVWSFFSNPENLAVITPPELNFITTSPTGSGHIYPGQIITYTITPVLGIKLRWITEITHVLENKMFVDEQRGGPYKFWHHQHHFTPTENGVLMIDIVHFALPFSILGRIAHNLFVKKQLENIFRFREEKVETLFNKK